MFAWEKRDNVHEEAHIRLRFYSVLHGGRETTVMKKQIEDSGSIRFCMQKRNNGQIKSKEDSGSMHFCMGEERQRSD